MSAIIDEAIAALTKRLEGRAFDGSAKFVVKGEGSVVIDGAGVRAGDDDTDVTLTASAETFEAIFAGEQNPTTAFMTGKLSLDGDMSLAMRLASVLG